MVYSTSPRAAGRVGGLALARGAARREGDLSRGGMAAALEPTEVTESTSMPESERSPLTLGYTTPTSAAGMTRLKLAKSAGYPNAPTSMRAAVNPGGDSPMRKMVL